MKGSFAAGGGEPPGQVQQASAQGFGGHGRALPALADTEGPAAQVVADDVEDHPGGVGPETPRGQMIQADTVFEVTDHVLDDGVAAVVSLEVDGLAVAVADEGVVVVGGQ